MKKYYLLLAVFIGLLSCSEEQIVEDGTKQEIIEAELKSAGDGKYDILGYGYDITGEYVGQNSIKRQVIDVQAFDTYMLSKGEKRVEDTFLGGMSERVSVGATATEFVKEIIKDSNFKGSIAETVTKGTDAAAQSAGQPAVSFSGGISKGSTSKHSYSSKYTFGVADYIKKQKQLDIYASATELSNYLTPVFKKELQTISADSIVKVFGTHVMLDITIGGMCRGEYRAAIWDETSFESKTRKVEGALTAAFSAVGISLSTSSSTTENTTTKIENASWECFINVVGGQTTGGTITYDINGKPSYTMSQGTWAQSVDDTHSRLVDVNWNKAYPIYDFIADPTKKAQVKAAVEKYIASRKLEMMDIAPLYQYWSGIANDHFYTLEKTDTQGGSWKYEYPVCYMFKKQTTGTIPLYQYWNGIANDHFYSTEYRTDQSQWKYEYVVGYVYKTQVPGTVPLYQYWSGIANDHFYSLEKTDIKGGSWKYEYPVCYVYPLN